MGVSEVRSFLSYLAQERNVAASTQNQALHALLFLYSAVLEQPLEALGPIVRARRPKRLPVVLTRDEVATILHHLTPPYTIIAGLLYGSGLRLLEGLRLRVKDLDFAHIVVRDGKGQKDRITMLPDALVDVLTGHLIGVPCTKQTFAVATGGSIYPTPSPATTPKPLLVGPGNRSFPPTNYRRTHAAKPSGGTISTSQPSRKPFTGPLKRPASPGQPPATQLKSDSIGWRTRLTASEKARSVIGSSFCPFFFLTGV